MAAAFLLAQVLSKRTERMNSFVSGPLPAFVIIAPLAAMTLRQPDFGSTVMLAAVLFAMLFAAGARRAHLAMAGAGALALMVFQAVHAAYRMRRLTAFLDPWHAAGGAGFQLVQSYVALGAGGGWGVGLGASRQKMFYLPQAHTDFVFSVIGEEFGMVGALAVIALFAVILWRGMRIAHNEPDQFASLLAVGLTALLSLQAVVNIAVVIGIASDERFAAAVCELRRDGDGNLDGRDRRAARACARAGGAMRVIIAGGGTGGHLFPAVALGEEIQASSAR